MEDNEELREMQKDIKNMMSQISVIQAMLSNGILKTQESKTDALISTATVWTHWKNTASGYLRLKACWLDDRYNFNSYRYSGCCGADYFEVKGE